MGTIPAHYDEGFCGVINDPRFIPSLRVTALRNLGTMNEAIAMAATGQGGCGQGVVTELVTCVTLVWKHTPHYI